MKEEQVLAAIEFLAGTAQARQVVTYGELGRAIGGLNARREVPRLLWAVHSACMDHNVPSLAALVVNQSELRPGAGYWTDPNEPADLRDIQWLHDLREVWRYVRWGEFVQQCPVDDRVARS